MNDFGTDTEKHQIENVLKLINESKLCQGYHLETKELILAMLPYHLEHISRMSEQDSNSVSETVAYSDEYSRIQNRQSIHPYCNKRFMHTKEIEQQLQEYRKEKRNCMQREEYWGGGGNSFRIQSNLTRRIMLIYKQYSIAWVVAVCWNNSTKLLVHLLTVEVDGIPSKRNFKIHRLQYAIKMYF